MPAKCPDDRTGRDRLVVQYRNFRNDDPPGLVEIWNETFLGRGCVQLRHGAALERFVFSKPFFDPAGLVVAVEGPVRVGFAHAGFGCNNAESLMSTAAGVTCLVGVRPAYQHRGIGSELLGRCEEYLLAKGARTLYAGPMRPTNPFYFGLYGGSDQPGFLASDTAAAPFMEYQGYGAWSTCLVFQRRLDQPVNVTDVRFAALRKKFDLRVVPRTSPGTWWQECVLAPLEPLEFRLGNGRIQLALGLAGRGNHQSRDARRRAPPRPRQILNGEFAPLPARTVFWLGRGAVHRAQSAGRETVSKPRLRASRFRTGVQARARLIKSALMTPTFPFCAIVGQDTLKRAL